MEALPRSPYAIAIVLAFILGEFLWRKYRAKSGYDLGASVASVGVAVGNSVLKPFTGALITGVFLALYQITPFRIPMDDWRAWLVGFLLVEFVYYWFHRWSHTVRWLWASHAVHHTARELTFPAAIRLGWTNIVSGGWLLFAPLVIVGFNPLMIAALLTANLLYQFFLHTELVGKLGPLEWVLNTPSHHRVHHASNADYLDKNFGGVVIVYDRLFGSFADERAEEKPRYGLVHEMNSKNPFVIALHEWGRMFKDMRQAHSVRGALAVAFGRPH